MAAGGRDVDYLKDGQADVDEGVDRELNQVTNRNASTLVKHKQDTNKTEQDKTAAVEDTFVFYQENFGVISSPFVSDGLLNWVSDLGEPLVLEAMKRAVERNKLSWGYVKSILQAWAGKGISRVEDAKAEEVAFRNERKQLGRVDKGQRSAEVVPDWFEEHRRQAALKKGRGRLGEDSVSDAEVLAMLEKHGGGVLL